MDNITLIQPFNLDTTQGYTFANVSVGTGNVTAGNANLGNLTTSNFFSGNGSLLTSITGSNVTGAVAYATTANSVAGANVTGQVGNALVAGTVYTAAQPNITSVGTLSSVTVTGNATVGNLITSGNISTGGGSGGNITGANVISANYFVGAGNGLSAIAGANVTGQVGNALVAGTVYTAAQPNITSVGTLTTLTVSGTSNFGAVGNVTITGGTTGQVLTTNGSGGLSWTTVSGGGGSTYGDSNVATYLPTYTGNLSPGNLTVPVANLHVSGGSSGQYLKTDGSGTLSWATVSGGSGSSLTYTAATTPPGSANVADQWYNTSTGVLYEYVNDGTTSYWVDVQSPTLSTAPVPVIPHPFVFLGI
jgi:hypothetical protein